jgi:hypothetical protein
VQMTLELDPKPNSQTCDGVPLHVSRYPTGHMARSSAMVSRRENTAEPAWLTGSSLLTRRY